VSVLDGIKKTIEYFSNELKMIKEEEARQRVYNLAEEDFEKSSVKKKTEL
jgi:hypothetical protein